MRSLFRRAMVAFAGLAIAGICSAQAQITLYEHDNFGGQQFRASDTVSNLGRAGFNDRASSVMVRGGQWQLCSDADFRGQCVTLNPGEYRSLNNMGLNDKVSSVRPIQGAYGNWNDGNNNNNNGQWGGASAYNPNATNKLTARDTGHCRLINTNMGRDLFNGVCQMKQTIDGNQTKFTFRMGNAQPYVFVSRGGVWEFANPYGGTEPVRYKDLGHNAVFRWGDYRLEVDEDL